MSTAFLILNCLILAAVAAVGAIAFWKARETRRFSKSLQRANQMQALLAAGRASAAAQEAAIRAGETAEIRLVGGSGAGRVLQVPRSNEKIINAMVKPGKDGAPDVRLEVYVCDWDAGIAVYQVEQEKRA